MEMTNQRLRSNPSVRTVCSSDRALKDRNHSKVTIVQKATVRASSRLILDCAQLKIRNIPTPINVAMKVIRRSRPGNSRPTLGCRGGCLSSSPNLGSSPRGIPVAVSVTRFTQIICSGSSGALPMNPTQSIKASSSPKLVLSRKKTTLRSRLNPVS